MRGQRAGNVVLFKYLKSTKWVRNALADEDVSKLRPMVAAQAYQESGLDQRRRSQVCAISVMQVMSTAAADRRVNIRGIDKLEANIHAGTKYLRLLVLELRESMK